MAYDDGNVFARILRGELPCDRVAETDRTLAFRDIAPQAPVHVLVIPKGAYENLHDFLGRASADEIADLFAVVGRLTGELGLRRDGYRLLSNTGRDGGQEIPHFHVQLLGGRDLGRLVDPA